MVNSLPAVFPSCASSCTFSHMPSCGWSSQCPNHPSQLPAGVCPLCLRERLAMFLEHPSRGAADAEKNQGDHHHKAQEEASANSPSECASSFHTPIACQGTADGLDSPGKSIGPCSHGGPPALVPEEITQSPSDAAQGLDALDPSGEERIRTGSTAIAHSCNPGLRQRDFAGPSCDRSFLTPDNIAASFNSTAHSQSDVHRSPTDNPFPVQRSLSFHEDSTTSRNGGKAAALWRFSALRMRKKLMRKKTLSPLRNIDASSPTHPHIDHKTCASLSPLHVSHIASHRTVFHETKQSEHRSSSKWSTLFGGHGRSARLSWFSSLFRKHRRKSRPESVQNFTSGEDYTLPWEAPRSSAWEQIGYSSAWDRPRSSWQGATSWASDTDSIYSGVDSFHDSLARVREDAELETQLHDHVMVDTCNAHYLEREDGGEEIKTVSQNTNASSASQAMLRTPPSEELRFVKPKVLHVQRDAATQTTPPRRPIEDNDGTTAPNKTFRKKSSQSDCATGTEASHSWSRIWIKTFSNSKATKHKQKSVKGGLDNMMDVGEQSSVISTSSTKEGGYNTHNQDKVSRHCEGSLQWESSVHRYGAWDAYYSSGLRNIHSSGGSQQQNRYTLRGTESIGAGKGRANSLSPLSIENGLLRFYLTPVRSASATRCRPKQYRTLA